MIVDAGQAPRETTPDPKRPPRVRLARRERAQLHVQVVARRRCLVCQEMPAQTMHHLVPRGAGGDDVLENLIPVCGDGTTGCHGDIEARRNGARETVRERLSQSQVDYVTARESLAYLDRHYPLRDAPDVSLREAS